MHNLGQDPKGYGNEKKKPKYKMICNNFNITSRIYYITTGHIQRLNV